MNAKNKNRSRTITGLGIAVGAAAALAGAYFLYGPSGAKNRKKVKGWMLKAKGEVLEEIEKLKEVTPEAYNAAVEKVVEKYNNLPEVNKKDLDALGRELKKYWNHINAAAKGNRKKK